MARAGDDLLAPLRSAEPGPLYLLFGKERFLIDQAVELLRERVLEPATRDFNYELFFGKEVKAQRIVEAARTLPMMARRRLVLVRGLDEMKADELAALVPYVTQPAPETCLVLVADKVDQRWKLVTAFKKRGLVLKLDPPYERQLPGFVQAEGRRREIRFEPGVAQRIADEIGAELGQLADAVERLAIFVGSERPVSLADVEKVLVATRQHSVFDLANAVGEGDRPRALTTLAALLGHKEPGVRIVAMIARHVRQLWKARTLLDQRRPKGELAAALGIPPFFVDGIEAQARRRSPAVLEQLHGHLFEADRALKSSRLSDERILERLILRLTANPQP